jgi:hypothetical protein
VAKLERGLVHAYRRYLAGKFSLHGGSACSDGRAIVLVGASRSGKSTATARLCDAHGFQILADDVVAIDHVGGRATALPTERYHWLRADAAEWLGGLEDQPVGTGQPGDASLLAAVVHLRPDDAAAHASKRRLRGSEAAAAIVANTIRLPMREHRRLLADLEHARQLCEHVPVWQVTRGHKTPLAEVIELLLSIFQTE